MRATEQGGLMSRVIAFSGVLLVLTACGAEVQPVTSVSERDSAGVRIVEYGSIPANLASWSLSDTADVIIGSIGGDGPELFGRLVSVVELSDGTIVVADAQARELRAFDRFGEHLWTAGGSGEGPGEFATIQSLFVIAGDSMVAIDDRLRRGSVFDRFGRFTRQFRVELVSIELGRPAIIGAMRDGRLVGWTSRYPVESGRSRASLVLNYLDREGAIATAVANLPGTEWIVSRVRSGMAEQGAPIWGRRTEFSVGEASVVAATQDRFEVLRFGSAGQLEMIVRVFVDPRVADDTVHARFADRDLPGGVMIPDTLPAIGRIHLDSDDRLWVEEYVAPYEDREPSWWVFDREGIAVATATIPPEFEVHHVGSQHMLGVWRDSLDVPYVERRVIVVTDPS